VLFILRIPLSPTSLLTDVRGGVAMRKSVKHSNCQCCVRTFCH